MKILIIGPAHPYRGGIADTNESFCQSLINEGHDASIMTFTVQYPNFLFPGKTQYTTDPLPENTPIVRAINTINPFNWMSAARKINKLKPQLVIVRYWIPFLAPCLGSIIRLVNKDITTIAMCDNVIPHERKFIDRPFTQYFVNSFDGFITLSSTTLAELNQFTKKDKAYFPHPINNNLGNVVPKDQARDYLNLDKNGRYLLFFGLIREYKGLDLTIKALGVEKIKHLNIRLLIVGEFYEPQERYLDLIRKLGLEDNITIVDQFIPTEEIKYYFSAVDMAIQTYKTATQSGVSQMAFNFNCPILVTDVGGLSEVVLHEKVGYVTSKDPESIADSIIDLYENDRKEAFINNIESEKHKYTWKGFGEQTIQLYDRIQNKK